VTALALPLTRGSARNELDIREVVVAALGASWPFWAPVIAVAVVSLVRRRRSLSLLHGPRTIATCVAVVSATIMTYVSLGAIGRFASWIIYPILLASFATAYAGVVGRPSPTATILRRVAPPLALGVIALATIATLIVPQTNENVAMASLGHLGCACALVAVALH